MNIVLFEPEIRIWVEFARDLWIGLTKGLGKIYFFHFQPCKDLMEFYSPLCL